MLKIKQRMFTLSCVCILQPRNMIINAIFVCIKQTQAEAEQQQNKKKRKKRFMVL